MKVVITTLAATGLMAAALTFFLAAPQSASAAPPNDNLANAIDVSVPLPAGIVATGTNVDATLEAGEVSSLSLCTGNFPSPTVVNSVWYRWVSPPTPGAITIDTFGSGTDTVLAVFTGTSHPLTQVACHDFTTGLGFGPSFLELSHGASETYYIQVGTFIAGGPPGPILLSMADGAGLYASTTLNNNVSDVVLTLQEAMHLASNGTAELGRAVSAGESAFIVNSAEMGANGEDLVRVGVAGVISVTSALPTVDQNTDHFNGLGIATINGGGTSPQCIVVSGQQNTVSGFDVANCIEGIRVTGTFNRLGGSASPTQRNTIRNNQVGVNITGESADNNFLLNNYIGTDPSGTTANGNADAGVSITAGADNNSVGVAQPEMPNIISGNSTDGVLITGVGTTGNFLGNNHVGLGATGGALPNHLGVTIIGGATGNIVGQRFAPGTGQRNVISGNTSLGVFLHGAGTSGNIVRGNYIGLDVAGTTAIGNESGVFISNSASDNVIGGTLVNERNFISGNQRGVNIHDSDTTGNFVRGNHIGLGATGLDVGNVGAGGSTGYGVLVDEASGNVIGGSLPGQGNVVSGNEFGISFFAGEDNIVQGNLVGTNAAGTAAIPNDFNGVTLRVGATNNLVGGDTPAERNVISGNGVNGVDFIEAATAINVISGNYIGTNAAGTAAIPNLQSGIAMFGGPNRIGGVSAGEGNLISGNSFLGISIAQASSSGSSVLGNRIGTNHTGLTAIPNSSTGVLIGSDAANIPVDGNVIAFNGNHGVGVIAASSDGVSIVNNSIHSNGGLGISLTNAANDGVLPPVITGASATSVTGTACSSCVVQIFSDSANEGRHHIGSATTTAGGTFSATLFPSPPAANLTATATDNLSTSQFSATFAAELCNGLDDDSDFQVDEGHPNADGDVRKDCVDTGQMVFYPTGHALTAPTVDCSFIAEDVDAFKDTDGCPEPDNDNDGFTDATDDCPGTNSQTGADGALGAPQDTNLNGVRDGAEAALTTDDVMPLLAWEDKDGVLDTDGCHDSPGDDFDGDGLTDDNEVFTVLTDAGNPDTDSDAMSDGADNCPLWANGAQALPSWPVPAQDSDCDGFNKTREQHVGTDPTKHCNGTGALNDEPDYWPTDFNDSRFTNLADVSSFNPTYNKLVGEDGYSQRHDLNASNSVTLSDVSLMNNFYNKSCG